MLHLPAVALLAVVPSTSLSRGDDHLIQPFQLATSHNNGPWMSATPHLEDGSSPTFYSQFEEDRALVQRYPQWLSKRNGTYLEMGALDGYRLSNTMFFYESLGWRGMLVEPQPACKALMQQHRPEDARHSNASCSDFRTLEFQMPNGDACAAGSGGTDFISQKAKLAQSMKPVQVGCSPIGHMLRVSGIRKLDLWSLDVEGAELETLRGMDWEGIPVHVLVIEMLPGNNPKGQAGLEEIRQYLASKGMVNMGRIVGTSGYDELWENPNFHA